jgi:hypothetical protein
MTLLYREINVPNLEILQEQIMNVFPEELYKNPRIFFPPDQSVFFKIPELVNLLDLYKLKNNITYFGFHALRAFNKIPTHIDCGDIEYSMNIPLKNCNKTFTNFYSTDGDPELIPERILNGVKYTSHYSFTKVKIKEMDKFESNIPYVMHIKTAHDVINLNPCVRINLLIRHDNNNSMSKILNSTDWAKRA